ncbi:2-methylcitrate dehydratase [Priestia filamentosa]|uniref:2-methylcitrate dehydratase n=1 Tax=Priestia filamentosa TaxID=1402861 RepID=A0A0H4KGJ6_9BACI|nr:helix-turn-helix domain-containing protein [Priestia filamentosa]AKO92685.1 2-methylcitrate dehydratase [Priestia filamentosa]
MSYSEFKPVIKKINLKPDGKQEIVLEVTDGGLKGKIETLMNMIDCKVNCSIESQVVNYNVTLNSKTHKPITTYEVDDKGVVSEVKPQIEQLEADLGLPKEKIKTEEDKRELELAVVDEFILSGLAPQLEDEFAYDMAQIIKRKAEGETYMKIANELDISSGKIVELVDEYRAKVAPLAEKWAEWKEEKEDAPTPKEESSKEQQENIQKPSKEELSAQIDVSLPKEEEEPKQDIQEDEDHGAA